MLSPYQIYLDIFFIHDPNTTFFEGMYLYFKVSVGEQGPES